MDDVTPPGFVGAAADLLARMACVHLATVTAAGAPHASVTPFVHDDGALYVYLSALAAHAGNLRATPVASVLLVRDEAQSPEPFARTRVTVQCRASEEPRGSAAWARVMDRYEARFGATAATVRSLTDFTLFRLEPQEARVVTGFGRARRLDPAALARLFRAAGEP